MRIVRSLVMVMKMGEQCHVRENSKQGVVWIE